MNFLRGIFFGLVQVIELPVNVLLELWRLPGRGRGLLFGFPSFLVLMLTLLAIGWAKYGSNQELISDYWRSHRIDKERLSELNRLIGDVDDNASSLGVPDDSDAPAVAAAPVVNEGVASDIVTLVQREIVEPRNNDFIGNPRVAVRVALNDRRSVEQVEILQPSSFPSWDERVRNALLRTEAFRRAQGEENMAKSMDLVFGLLETQREKLLYTMIIGLKKLIDLDPSKPQFKFEYAILSAAMRKPLEAKLMMDQVAPPEKPGLCEGHIWQARQIWSDKSSVEAVASRQQRCMNHLRLALASDPINLEANEGLGELYFSLGNLAVAEKHYRIVWDKQLSTTLRLVAIYKQQNDLVKLDEILSKTKIRLEEALKNDPNNVIYIFDIERIYLLKGQNSEAIEFLLSQVNDANREKIYPRLARIYAGWAKVDALQNKNIFNQEAFEKTKKALEYDPNLAVAFWILTVIGTQGASFAPEAVALYDPVKNRADAPAMVLREYAGYLIKQERMDEAVSWLEEAYTRFADDPITANNLAFLLVSATPPNAERALTIISKAIEGLPNGAEPELRASLYDTKAVALVALHRPVDAIPYLEASLQHRVNDRRTMTALRECYKATGQKEIEEFYQRRLDELGPEPTSNQ